MNAPKSTTNIMNKLNLIDRCKNFETMQYKEAIFELAKEIIDQYKNNKKYFNDDEYSHRIILFTDGERSSNFTFYSAKEINNLLNSFNITMDCFQVNKSERKNESIKILSGLNGRYYIPKYQGEWDNVLQCDDFMYPKTRNLTILIE